MPVRLGTLVTLVALVSIVVSGCNETELVDRDWTIDPRRGEVLGASKNPDGDLNFNIGVIAGAEDLDAYSVILVVAFDE